MIYQSVWIMTLFDVLILGVVGYSLIIFLSGKKQDLTRQTRYGFAAILLGLSLIGLIYLADLATMHILPLFMPEPSAMAMMYLMHLHFNWFAVLLGVGAISIGHAAANHGVFCLIGKLEESGKRLKGQLVAREEAEETKRENQHLLKAVVDSLPAMINAKNQESRYIFMNQYQADLYRVSSTEAVSRTAAELLGSTYGNFTASLDREVFTTGKAKTSYEEHWTDPTGEPYVFLTTKVPLCDDNGAVTNVVTVALDITERKKAEEELLASRDRLEEKSQQLAVVAEQLAQSRNHAEAANRAKSEFLAAMSHELRTPLNAILGFSEIIKDKVLGPTNGGKYCDYAADIHNSAGHLLALINDILDLSKIESGVEQLDEESIEVTDLVESVLRLVKMRAMRSGVELKLEIRNDLPFLIADRRKAIQILVNLLANAVKFTNRGGKVTLKVWYRATDGFVLQVVDTGIGIALNDIPKAFAPFQQIDSALNRKYEGTGLGLPLSKSLVELHGGSLDLQSQIGSGTTVTIRFPATRTGSDVVPGNSAGGARALG